MAELHFESKEVEEYYRKERRVLGVGHPCRWDSQKVITKEDVDNYVKDAKNIHHPKELPAISAGSSFSLQSKTAAQGFHTPDGSSHFQ